MAIYSKGNSMSEEAAISLMITVTRPEPERCNITFKKESSVSDALPSGGERQDSPLKGTPRMLFLADERNSRITSPFQKHDGKQRQHGSISSVRMTEPDISREQLTKHRSLKLC